MWTIGYKNTASHVCVSRQPILGFPLPIFGLILSKALQTFRLANRVFHVSRPGSPPRPFVTLEVSTICVRECEGKPMGFLEVARVTINTRQRPFLIKDSKKVGKKLADKHSWPLEYVLVGFWLVNFDLIIRWWRSETIIQFQFKASHLVVPSCKICQFERMSAKKEESRKGY